MNNFKMHLETLSTKNKNSFKVSCTNDLLKSWTTRETLNNSLFFSHTPRQQETLFFIFFCPKLAWVIEEGWKSDGQRAINLGASDVATSYISSSFLHSLASFWFSSRLSNVLQIHLGTTIRSIELFREMH